MANKKGSSVRLETEIEKSREDGRWLRVIELAEQLKQGSPNHALADFLLGEGKMESFFEENPPVENNWGKAKSGLSDARNFLTNATSELGKKARVALDANLLLGKLSYACGRYDECLKYYNNAELESLTEKELPCRGLKIVAESYAINGLCLEKSPPSSTSKYRQSEQKEKVSKCFELATDLTLLYLQKSEEQQQYNSTTSTGSHSLAVPLGRQVGPILESALQKALAPCGDLEQRVSRYRSMLMANETSATQSLRLVLARQLAELLLRSYRGSIYKAPGPKPVKVKSEWKPKNFNGVNLFVPNVDNEEVILLLMLAEEMAVRDTVLSQAAEFQNARRAALDNVKFIYDLLAIAVVRWRQTSVLNEVFDRAMKFSFRETHIWMQRSLCLLSCGRHFQALAVLKHAKSLAKDKTYPCLLGARICYEFLERPKEGSEWSLEAIERETARPQNLLGRCWMYRGIGLHLQAQGTNLKDEKETLSNQAFDALSRALHADPNDHLIEYYLALHLACQGRVSDAIAHAQSALAHNGEHSATLQLLTLLLTAQKRYDEAASLIEWAHSEYPDHINIMYIKATLELERDRAATALVTAQNMLAVWKKEFEDSTIQENSDMSDRQSETRSVFQLYTSEMSDKDTSSIHAQSIAASRVEHALSEVASSISSSQPRRGPQHAWLVQVQIWLLLGEIYLRLEEVSSATACVHEAALIFPLSHQVLFMRGLIHEQKGEYVEAKQWYQNATAVNPYHVRSLQHLGLIYHYLGRQRLAEKTLRVAAVLEPRAYLTWYHLGLVLETVGEHQAAADCMASALDVETISPVLSYTAIPLPFE